MADEHGHGEHKSKLQLMKDKSEAVQQLIDTLEIHHHEAYTGAANKYLLDKDSKNIDYKKLKSGEVQEKFAEHMVDFYLTKAKERFGISKEKKLSEVETDL